MRRATIRRCPGPESIRGREASAGSSWGAGKWSVAGTWSGQRCFLIGRVFVYLCDDLVLCAFCSINSCSGLV